MEKYPVRVNQPNPSCNGMAQTPAWLGPDDIAQVVAYLVSPLSHRVTAAEWSVDGGAQRHI